MSSLIESSSINQAVGAVTVVEERADIKTESPPQKNNISNATVNEFERLLSTGTCGKPDAIVLFHNDINGTNQVTQATGNNFYGYNSGNVTYFVGTFTNVDGSIQTRNNGQVALALLDLGDPNFGD